MKVDPGLVEMADKLNGKVIPIPMEESSLEIVPTKIVRGSRIEFELRYNLEYVGGDYSAVWGISAEQMRWYLGDALVELGFRTDNLGILYFFPSTLRFALPIPEDVPIIS